MVMPWRRSFAFFVLAASILASGPAGALEGRELKPLMWGWERHFAVEYGPGEYRGHPVVEGWVTNVSPYIMRDVKILVDTLDASGAIAAQRVAYVPGEMPGGSRLFFQVPAAPAPAYRVQVFSYDRFESGGGTIR
jgi:hypothetical protein